MALIIFLKRRDVKVGNFKVFDGNITSPKGFRASGVYIGLKKKKKDMTLITSDVLADSAGVFTTNKACAAPVLVSKQNVANGKVQAIIINSANANACTGKKGYEDALATVKAIFHLYNIYSPLLHCN